MLSLFILQVESSVGLFMSIVNMYFILINAVTFLAFGYDKQQARQQRWRLSEKLLLLLILAGGSLGAFSGMGMFHHKTKKPLFKYTVPLILVFHLFIYQWFF